MTHTCLVFDLQITDQVSRTRRTSRVSTKSFPSGSRCLMRVSILRKEDSPRRKLLLKFLGCLHFSCAVHKDSCSLVDPVSRALDISIRRGPNYYFFHERATSFLHQPNRGEGKGEPDTSVFVNITSAFLDTSRLNPPPNYLPQRRIAF